jgi:hypothetical protein
MVAPKASHKKQLGKAATTNSPLRMRGMIT